MNYYIQGDCARAEEIKEALKKLGCDVKGFDMCNNNILFFTYKLQTGGKVLSTTNANLYTANIIKTHPDYKELELPVKPKFKVHDWVISINEPSLTYRILETNVTNEQDELDYKVEVYSGGIYRATYFITSSKMDEWGRLWTIKDAKDGDVLVTTKIRSCPFIYRKPDFNNDLAYYYAGVDGNGDFCEGCIKRTLYHFGPVANVAPATKEQRDLLFARMLEAGYQWDADKKELKKIQSHYDIANFKAGMPVLVRADYACRWDYSVFSRITGNEDWKFAVCNGVSFTQCIPFEGNEHLLGTTDMCDERFINW